MVTYRETSHSSIPEKAHSLINIKDNSSLVVLGAIKFEADGTLEKASLNNKNYLFEDILAQKFADSKMFSIVRKSSDSNVSSIFQHPNHSYSVTVLLSEDSNVSSSFGSYLLRIISLGFYPQVVEKYLKYEIKAVNINTRETLSFDEMYTIVVSYKAPFLLIPVNIDSHPFSYRKQAQIFVDLIFPKLIERFKEEKLNTVRRTIP